MLVDMFGTPLAVGQHVLFSEIVQRMIDGEQYDVPELSLYKILKIEYPDVVTAEALNGEAIGDCFYLSDSVHRLAIIGYGRAMWNTADCYTNTAFS